MIDKVYGFIHRIFSAPQERGEYSAGYWQNQIRKVALEFCRYCQGNLLEIGCGEGLFLGQVLERNSSFKLWGVDNSAERIAQASKRLDGKGVNLSVADATVLTFADGYFNAVVCINVFFNMPSIEVVRKTLEQMRRVCRQDGVIIFDFRNAANPLLALKYALAPLYDKTVRNLPLKTYYLWQFEKMLEGLEMKIVDKIYIGCSCEKMAPIIMIKAQRV